MSIRHKKLPIEALERIDDLCADFERNWQQDQPTSIESVLQVDLPEPEHEVLLAELIALDIDYRQRRGDPPNQQEYLERFPGHGLVIEDLFSDQDKPTAPFQAPSIATLSEHFPQLEIIELLGAGGMGAVYKARQTGLDRLVALKILPQEFAHDVKFALRFTREARTLAKLNHPNIVSVYEFGKAGETYYFLMEFVDGPTLRQIVGQQQLSPQHALTIVPHLCDALQFAHNEGIIHRDIKPENILMTREGSIKIADFGLSRILGNDSQPTALTATHQVMGTPRYMAPEQMTAAGSVDHRADIYSLGVVFYEMLTGELPIGRFEVPSQKVHVDVRLDDIVLRTLEAEPQRRYQHASQIKSDVLSLTSTADPNLAPTGALAPSEALAPSQTLGASMANPSAVAAESHVSVMQQQELAGRLLLTRRELMQRVKQALRPLFYGQLFQILIGIATIALGAQCWASNTQIPHRLTCGLIVHVYGVLLIIIAANVLVRIKRIDDSKPIEDVRHRVDDVKHFYLRFGSIIGFPWWLMWIPFAVTMGFDVVLHPNSLYPGLIVGAIGLLCCFWLYRKVHQAPSSNVNQDKARSFRDAFAGKSLAKAYLAISEIEQAKIL